MHDQSVFQRQADVVKGDSLEQAGRIEGNVAVGAVDDGGGEYFSVGQIAFPCARDGRQPFDGKGNVRSGPVIFTYSAFSIMAASFRMAGRRAA